MDKYIKENLNLWNELTGIHEQAKSYYDLDHFKAGKSSLRSIELNELGDVSGKSLLHLQCHFGMDTLSWARMGATVTGVDFSDQAIDLAKSLSAELEIDADFICSDIYDLSNNLDGTFDIVFTSYGVLCWLPDLYEWARVIAHFLKPGGTFYIVDGHPFSMTLENQSELISDFRVTKTYFGTSEPAEYEPDVDYADKTATVTNPSYEWTHSMGEIISAVAMAGLRVEFLHEFPYCDGDYHSNMEQDEEGWWKIRGKEIIPLTFSLKAIK